MLFEWEWKPDAPPAPSSGGESRRGFSVVRKLSGRTITFGIRDATVASISTTGVATGLKAGSATITAASEGKSATAVLTVTPATSGDGTAPT